MSAKEIERTQLERGDLLFARRSLTLAGAGKCSIFYGDPATTFESSIIRCRLNRSIAVPEFYYYFFGSRAGRAVMNTIVEQTAVAGIRSSDLAELPVPSPPLKTQHAIASMLAALDDKIELNRNMSRTLNEAVSTLFDARFVRFEGRAVAAETGLPEGWTTRPYSETVEILSGGTPKTTIEEYWNGDIPWFAIADAPGSGDVFVLATAKRVTPKGIANSAAQVLPAGTTILTARGTVGLRAIAGVDMAINQSCFGLRGVHEGCDYYTYAAAGLVVSRLRQYSHGSVFSTINRSTFSSVSIIDPPAEAVLDYERLVSPFMERIRLNGLQSRTLACLRDALLPRLLKGELRIIDAEKVVEEVA